MTRKRTPADRRAAGCCPVHGIDLRYSQSAMDVRYYLGRRPWFVGTCPRRDCQEQIVFLSDRSTGGMVHPQSLSEHEMEALAGESSRSCHEMAAEFNSCLWNTLTEGLSIPWRRLAVLVDLSMFGERPLLELVARWGWTPGEIEAELSRYNWTIPAESGV